MRVTIVVIFWILIFAFSLYEGDRVLDVSKLKVEIGVSKSARCFISRSVQSIVYVADLNGGETVEREFPLNWRHECNDDILINFYNKPLKVKTLNGDHMEVVVNGVELVSLEEKIYEFQDQSGNRYFLYFLGILLTFYILNYGKRNQRG